MKLQPTRRADTAIALANASLLPHSSEVQTFDLILTAHMKQAGGTTQIPPAISDSPQQPQRDYKQENQREEQNAEASTSGSGAEYWQDLLGVPEPDMFGNRARSASDAAVLRRKGHLKEQDLMIEFMLRMHETHTSLEVMQKMEKWIAEHQKVKSLAAHGHCTTASCLACRDPNYQCQGQSDVCPASLVMSLFKSFILMLHPRHSYIHVFAPILLSLGTTQGRGSNLRVTGGA